MKRKYFIKELFNVVSGSTPSTSIDSYWSMNGDGIKWITPKDLSKLKEPFIHTTERKISLEGLKSCSANLIPPGSIIISSRAPIGYVAVLKDEMCCNQGCKALIPKQLNTIDSLYFYYLLLTKESELNNLGSGSTFKELSKTKLEEFQITIHDIQTQKQIAAIVEDADHACQQRKAANALTEHFLQSSFLHLFGDLVSNSKNWPTRRLDEVATLSSGVTKGRNLNGADTITVPYMRVANVQDGYLNLSEIKTIEIKSYELEKYLLRKGDILLTEGGDPDKLGRGAVWQNQIKNAIHQNHIFKVRSDSNLFSPEFLSVQFGSDYGKRYFSKAAKQTTGIASINSTQLKAFPVLIPPLPLQQHFASLVADAEILRQKQQQSERELEHLFQALLQQYFGEHSATVIAVEEPLSLAAETEVQYGKG